MITEDQLEQLCLDWFREGDYEYANGYDIAHDGDTPEREDYKQILLTGRLLDALQRINPQIPVTTLEEQVAHVLSKPEHPVLIQNNRTFQQFLLEGMPVEYTDKNGDKQSDHVQIIDFHKPDNNQFLVVNQFTIKGTKMNRRPDVVVFINGLPIAVIELKNPADENADVWNAYNQLQTYKDEISDLFLFNEALVISDGINARIGSLTANKERFLPWRTIKNENDKPLLEYQLEKVVRGFFDRELLLDYIRYFILFEQDGDKLIKKIAGYHQFHAVREAVRVSMIASRSPEKDKQEEERATYGKVVVPGSRKAGVVWHTQGSGKSISMVCYAGMLLQQPEMQNPTLVVVTDRNDLDNQLFDNFVAAKMLLKQTPVQADSRDDLRELLESRQSGGIIFTTVQKFSLLNGEEHHPALSQRSNIVVISDEAHRSQYGLKAVLDKKTGQYKFGYAKHLRDALPMASFIGFTGTPIATEDKDTRAVFGDYVSIYDIQDAVDDGATVPIYYESRLAKLDINQAEIEKLNEEVDEVMEDEEDVSAREKTKSKWAALEKLVGAEPRLKEVAEDLVQHFEERNATIEGKGMIVAMSREICAHLYNAITALRPDWHSEDIDKGAIKVIMTASASDKPLLQAHNYNKLQKKRLEKRFKDPADPLKLVIVRDMWLTGFDAPCAHTMYIDKPMRSHNLMQAIARVNRVFKDKPGGLVVDYIGIANELKHALKIYTDSKGKGNPANLATEAFSILVEKIDVVRGMFAAQGSANVAGGRTPGATQGFDYGDYETDATSLLIPAANHILGLDDGKKRFMDTVLAITKAFALCGTIDEAHEYKKEIAFFSAIKAVISKATTVDKKRTEDEKNSALKQILDNAVIAEGVTDVFQLAGLDKPNIGLLDDEFMEDIRQMKDRNFAVELLEKLLRDEIRSSTRNNVVQEKKYGDRLLETLRKYRNRAIETAQVIEELIQMAKDFQGALKRHEELGLNPDELAFYDALANNESAVRELGDDILKKIAHELVDKLRKSTTVDWQVRDSVRAKLRNTVRVLLRRYKYPPNKADEAIDLVLKQAEVLSASWSSIDSESESLSSRVNLKIGKDGSIDGDQKRESQDQAMLSGPHKNDDRIRSYYFDRALSSEEVNLPLGRDSEEEFFNDLLKDPRNVPVWFGTNRLQNNASAISEGFSDKWSEKTTYGISVVNIPKGHVPGSLGSSWWVRLVKGDDRLHILSIDSVPKNTYWSTLGAAMRKDKGDNDAGEALFFLHGYNVTFEQAAIRTAQLAYDLRIHPAIFFSWPSGGDVDDYPADEAAIEASYDFVTEFVSMLDACAFQTGTVLHVVAHSMGNRALLKALESIAKGTGGVKRSSIDKLVFAAPDVDARVFMQSLNKINKLGTNRTLYASQRDKAVWLSKALHKYPRAGLLPPVTIHRGLDTIDATDVDETFLGHSYIASVRALIHDLSSLLKTSLPPEERVGLEQEVTDDGQNYWRIK